MREKIRFNDGWMFHLGDMEHPLPADKGPIYKTAKTEQMLWGPAARHYSGYPDRYIDNEPYCPDAWERVTLPHDYIISQEPKQENNNALGFFHYQNAWYRKEFFLPEEDRNKRLTLYFEGIATHATVYLNGCVLKRNFCGYTSFEVDITDFARFGKGAENKNVLAVYVENTQPEGWWYQGGGIYRHVWLQKTDKVSVDLYGVYIKPIKKETHWEVPMEITLRNDGDSPVNAVAVTELTDGQGAVLASVSGTVTLFPRTVDTLRCSATVTDPILWDIDVPYQYTAVTKVFVHELQTDEFRTRFGFRFFRLDPEKGFFLNGRSIKIKGVCMHQDCGLTGKAVADNLQRYKIELIKEMGANGFRTSHYPHSEATMDALDELGLIVMDETRWFSSSDEAKEQLTMLIKRDRNRPSVFFWALGNEEPFFKTPQGARICKTLKALVQTLDDSRILTAAVDTPADCTIYEDLDAVGINYNLDKYEDAKKRYPDKTVFASECCATGTTRGWYDEDMGMSYLSAYDKDTNEWFRGRENTWKFLNRYDWILGGFQWIAFEHRGEAVWPRVCSQSGAIDLYLQKKDAFYQNQSHWSEQDMVHLMPHWNFAGREGEVIRVWAYTNCEECELYLNGVSQGIRRLNAFDHAEWLVPYEPGRLYVETRKGGKTVCTDEAVTTGEPRALRLRLDNRVSEANGEDVAILTCVCVDDEGREVPDARCHVFFSCNSYGQIIGTGSSVTDHTPVTQNERRMYAGKITLAVQVGTTPGTLKLYASSQNLKTAAWSIDLH